jgi:hypothetical protein
MLPHTGDATELSLTLTTVNANVGTLEVLCVAQSTVNSKGTLAAVY